MIKSIHPVVPVLLMMLAGATSLMAADTPVLPYVEYSIATEGPLSLLCTPDGSGRPMTQAFNSVGQPVDGTITMTLYDDTPPWGNPVAFFPNEDIWLTDITGSLALCPAGSNPDENTDINGMTSWTGALFVGGNVEPGDGNQLAIMVNGWIPDGAYLPDFRINSADLNGDLVVNLTDVAHFSMGYFGPYEYTRDLHWDEVVNLSDIAELARARGARCP
jgi:hypothetical protein